MRDGGCSFPPLWPRTAASPGVRRRPGRQGAESSVSKKETRNLKNNKKKGTKEAARRLFPITAVQVYSSPPCGHRACSDCSGKLKNGRNASPFSAAGAAQGPPPALPAAGGKGQTSSARLPHRSVCGKERGWCTGALGLVVRVAGLPSATSAVGTLKRNFPSVSPILAFPTAPGEAWRRPPRRGLRETPGSCEEVGAWRTKRKMNLRNVGVMGAGWVQQRLGEDAGPAGRSDLAELALAYSK